MSERPCPVDHQPCWRQIDGNIFAKILTPNFHLVKIRNWAECGKDIREYTIGDDVHATVAVLRTEWSKKHRCEQYYLNGDVQTWSWHAQFKIPQGVLKSISGLARAEP